MKSFTRVALLTALAAGLALAAPAQTPKDKAKAEPPADAPSAEKAEVTARIVERITDAHKLTELAAAHQAPELYVGAGRLFLQLKDTATVQPLEATPEVQTEDGKPVAGAKAETKKDDSFATLADDCFRTAEDLANKQGKLDTVTPLVKAVKANPWPKGERGAVGGPKVVAVGIGPKQSHVYTVDFVAGLPGAIGFQANPALRCKMVVQKNNFVHFNQVVNVGNYTWTPKDANNLARRLIITVVNPHNAPAQYRLFTN